MRYKKGFSLIELVIVLAIVGLCYLGGRSLLKKHVKNKSVQHIARNGAMALFPPSPWLTQPSDSCQFVKDNATALATWNNLDETTKSQLRILIASKMSIPTSVEWTLMCDGISYTEADQKKLKCTPGGGLVVAVYAPTSLPVKLAGEWFNGVGTGTQVVVMDKNCSTYRFAESFDKLVVGKWTNSGHDEIVFQLFNQTTSWPTHRIFVGQTEWEVKTEWQPCYQELGGGLVKKTHKQCVIGLATDPKGNAFAIGYEFFKDWYERPIQRMVLGKAPISILSPLNPPSKITNGR